MQGDMLVNVPKETPVRSFVRCVNAKPKSGSAPFRDPLTLGQVYIVYAQARPLNTSDELCYYIMDVNGKKYQPYDDVPAWTKSRFELVSFGCLN